MSRGVSIAALSVCAAAGAVAAILLAIAPGAGADDGTTTGTTATPTTVTSPATTTATTATTPTTPTTTTKQPPVGPKLIAAGVTIGGTLVGGLTVSEAREIVSTRFYRPLTLVAGTRSHIEMRPRTSAPRRASTRLSAWPRV